MRKVKTRLDGSIKRDPKVYEVEREYKRASRKERSRRYQAQSSQNVEGIGTPILIALLLSLLLSLFGIIFDTD